MGQFLAKRRRKRNEKRARNQTNRRIDIGGQQGISIPHAYSSLQVLPNAVDSYFYSDTDLRLPALSTSLPDLGISKQSDGHSSHQFSAAEAASAGDYNSVSYQLQQCGTKTLGALTGVPVLRSCPQCGALLGHDGDEKHVRCLMCDHQFCFACLQPTNSIHHSQQQLCRYGRCHVAPRQGTVERMSNDELIARILQQEEEKEWATGHRQNELEDLNTAILLSQHVNSDDAKDITITAAGDEAIGSERLEASDDEQVENRALKPLPGYIELTRQPCCVSLDDSPVDRALMPCRHVISVEGMKDLCENAVTTNREYEVRCPECAAVWDYFLVRHVMAPVSSPAELTQTAQKLNANMLARNDIKQCPRCRSYCSRDPPVDGAPPPGGANRNRVVCIACSRTTGRPIEFCWQCAKRWKGKGGKTCGNAGCDPTDWRLGELAACGTKTISGVCNVPALRGCERCGALIEHKEACKQMTCRAPGCRYVFCFVCLRPGGGHSCGNCTVAPRQKALPGK